MKLDSLPFKRSARILGLCVSLALSVGCGAVGPPIPPEDVGIAAKIRKQEQRAQPGDRSSEEPNTVPEDDNVQLPVFYPIGTR